MESTDPCAIVPLPQTDDSLAAFTTVAAQPAVVRVVRSLLDRVAVARVVIATTPALAADARACLRAAGLSEVAVTVAREPGSRRRVVIAGLKHLGLEPHSSTPVLIGDHRYPLSTGVVAGLVISELGGGRHDVVVPTLPVTDTVKTVDEFGSVLNTVDRAALRTVQYPRGFIASALWELVSGTMTSPTTADDEFASALHAGLAIGTVDGAPDAGQVELPRDAHLLDAIIACRPD